MKTALKRLHNKVKKNWRELSVPKPKCCNYQLIKVNVLNIILHFFKANRMQSEKFIFSRKKMSKLYEIFFYLIKI